MSLTDAALAAEVAEEAGELLVAVREEIGFLTRTTSAMPVTGRPTR